jgi:hypothetical protein
MPLDQTSSQKATTQAGIKDATPSIPSPQGVTTSSYPKQTPIQGSLTPSASGTYTTANTGSPWDALINALTPDQRAQWNAIGTSYEQRNRATQQARTDADLAVSGTQYNRALDKQVPTDAAGKATELYSLLTPEQQKLWKQAEQAEQGPGFFQAILPLVAAALAVAGGEAFLGASGAGAAGTAAAATTAPGVAASTAVAGQTAAATTAAAAALPEVAGTLAEIVVPVSGGASALGTIGAIAPELGAIGAMSAADLSGATMPTANYGSSTLQKIGMNALKQGGINAAISTVMGGDPLKGFESGFISGGIAGGLGAFEAGSGALDALGNTGIKAFNAAVSGAGTSLIMGGDPLKSAFTGGISSLAGSAVSDLLGTGANKVDLGRILGSTAASTALSSIMGGGKNAISLGAGAGIGTSTTPGATKPTTTPTTPTLPNLDIPTLPNRQTVNMPTVPYYGVGYGGGGAGGVASSDDQSYWGDDQEKLKKLLAALQQQGGLNGFV